MEKIDRIKDFVCDLINELVIDENEAINFFKTKFSYDELENVNLENRNLDINLRKISTKDLENSKYGDTFIKINKSNLKGNNVYGDLTPLNSQIYFWYSNDTFDDLYKSQYSEFFLDLDASDDLKAKYYNPKMKLVIDRGKQSIVFERRVLTFDEYMDNYEFLKGKYLGNFNISEEDKEKIVLVDSDAFAPFVSSNKCLSLKYRKNSK